jgi:hypothetical protein
MAIRMVMNRSVDGGRTWVDCGPQLWKKVTQPTSTIQHSFSVAVGGGTPYGCRPGLYRLKVQGTVLSAATGTWVSTGWLATSGTIAIGGT